MTGQYIASMLMAGLMISCAAGHKSEQTCFQKSETHLARFGYGGEFDIFLREGVKGVKAEVIPRSNSGKDIGYVCQIAFNQGNPSINCDAVFCNENYDLDLEELAEIGMAVGVSYSAWLSTLGGGERCPSESAENCG